MLPRRHFLQVGLTAMAAIPVLGGLVRPVRAGAVAAAGDAAVALPLHLVIFDEQIPQSVTFARAAAARGARTAGFRDGDATPIWYHDVDLAWRDGPVAIAGLTRHGPLFVFEQMAHARGLRVVARAEHTVRTDGRCEHVVASAPAEASAWVQALAGQGSESWAATMGALVTGSSAPVGQATRARVTTAAAGAAYEESLYTWVIAPVQRA
jgi:hypothetical protein